MLFHVVSSWEFIQQNERGFLLNLSWKFIPKIGLKCIFQKSAKLVDATSKQEKLGDPLNQEDIT